MKCTNKKITVFIILFSIFCCSGCGKDSYEMPYTASSEVSSFRIINTEVSSELADPFANDLCVVDSDISSDTVDMSRASGAALFDLNHNSTLYAKNVHEKL